MRIHTRTLALLTPIAVGMAAAFSPAQVIGAHQTLLGSPINFPGPTSGPNVTPRLDVQKMISPVIGYNLNGCIGCCVDNVHGHLWISARQDGADPTSPHKLIELYWDVSARGGRGDWAFEIYDQPANLTSSTWGLRDLAAGSGPRKNFIYGGAERSSSNLVWAFDVTKATSGNTRRSLGWTPSAHWKTNGIHTSLGVIRALAYHEARDTLFTADFNSDIVEFRQDGTQVQRWTPSRDWGTYGMAYDPLRQTILATGQQGSTYPGTANALVCYEFDPRIPGTGIHKETGTVFLAGDLTVAASRLGGYSGGCDLHISRREIQTLTPGVSITVDVPVLTWLTQAASDTVLQQVGRLQQYPHRSDGSLMPSNTGGDAGMAGDLPYLGNPNFRITVKNSKATQVILALSGAGNDFRIPAGAILIDPSPFSGFMMGVPATVKQGVASVLLPVPKDSRLAGISLFFQWVGNDDTLSSCTALKLVR